MRAILCAVLLAFVLLMSSCGEEDKEALFTVSFEANGGSAVATQQIVPGGLVVEPSDPARDGHSFSGWYVDSACTVVWNFGTDSVTSNTTLYAGWGYTVVFDTQGGSDVASGFVSPGSPVVQPVVPSKTTNTFFGWYTNSECTVAWDFSQPVSGEMTLYARWVGHTELVSVPGGTWRQEEIYGDFFTNTVSPFRMGKYEVTYELWHAVYSYATNNGYSFANLGREGHGGVVGDPPGSGRYEPVTTINWRDVIVWCNAYSEYCGYSPVYCSDGGYTESIKDSRAGAYGSSINSNAGSFDNPYINMDANGYRLPTEGEWQYAASYIDGSGWLSCSNVSGDTSSYCYPNDGGTSTVYGNYTWYDGNSGSSSHAVGAKLPNQLGIHDMSGNVWEWCQDWHGSWPTGTESGYTGSTTGTTRVIRGGAFGTSADSLRVGQRNILNPYYSFKYYGFRLSRIP